MILVQTLYPLFYFNTLRAFVDGQLEQGNVRVQRELVHRIDKAHVVENEEEDRGTIGARPVLLPREIYLFLGLLGDDQRLLDRDRGRLGRLEGVQQIQIVEKSVPGHAQQTASEITDHG